MEKEEIQENLNDIAFASVFHKGDETIHYFCPQSMPKGKYIILSATMDESFYHIYFRDWVIKSYPYHRAKYKGRLTQLTAYSMSRQCIQDHKGKVLEFINRQYCEYEVITFLRYENEFGAKGLHFGNVEGIDWLKGKNILIVGTPHQSEFVYKLIGCHLGMNVNEDTLVVRGIQSGGYEFNLMTYGGEEL